MCACPYACVRVCVCVCVCARARDCVRAYRIEGNASFNPRPGRGGRCDPPKVIEDSVRTAALRAAKFGTAYGATFLHIT